MRTSSICIECVRVAEATCKQQPSAISGNQFHRNESQRVSVCARSTSYWPEEDNFVLLCPAHNVSREQLCLLHSNDTFTGHNNNNRNRVEEAVVLLLLLLCSSGPYAILCLYLCGNDKSRRKRQWAAGLGRGQWVEQQSSTRHSGGTEGGRRQLVDRMCVAAIST